MDHPVRVDAEKLKRLRLSRSWTIEQLAEASGVSTRTVRHAETSKPISSRPLASIAKALGIEIDDLSTAMQDLPSVPRKPGKLENMKVFVASPGDLSEERLTFRKVIDEVNRIKANALGYLLEPLGWEDTLPGKGRPQALINQDVRQCQLFVVLMWKRWGTASGQYSSGTEEEFAIARKMAESNGGVPDIWLYFKSVPEAMLADPGEQLKKVIEFRTRIEVERSFLYRTFERDSQWETMFREHLCRWLDQQPPFELAPKSVTLPAEVVERIEALADHHTDPGATAQVTLQGVAVRLCRRAITAAGKGRLTEAEALFASSIETLPLPETLNAYIVYLELIGKRGQADAYASQLLDLHAMRGRAEREPAAEPPPTPIETCFIVHSSKDRPFVDRLYADLQSNGIPCWYSPQEVRIGDRFRDMIEEAIRTYDWIVLVLSKNSVGSGWIRDEVEGALEREHRTQRQCLLPIRLDDTVMKTAEPWAASIRRQRHIADFSHWEDDDSYAAAFERLLRDLKSQTAR